MTHIELRKKFFEFFEEKQHNIIPSASLIPENDSSTFFTSAGMQSLIPFLLGKKHIKGNRLVNIQKCIRTDDINEVGDNAHHTFFEMLGNWSLGDYFKKNSIEFSWEFLTNKKWLNLDKKKFAVSVFEGNEEANFDEESYIIWKDIFEKEKISEKRIIKLGKKDNWWGLSGQGPCGPDTEIFYWIGKEKTPEEFNFNNKNWVEIWNNVFMEYKRKADDSLEQLEQKNVDTGMGMERTLAIINNLNDDYATELFLPIIREIEKISNKRYKENEKEFRIIADHIKASVFILSEEIEPSNVNIGYVLRRLIRRAIRYGNLLGIKEPFTHKLVKPVLNIYTEIYPELKKNEEFIEEQLVREEEKFGKTLEKGLMEIKKMKKVDNNLGEVSFHFFSTYGFPLEMFFEEINKIGINYSKEEIEKEFQKEFQKHQELSRISSKGIFKGGIADNSEQAIKYHTATHLLHSALRNILGEKVEQKGSNINSERLRFDFSYSEKLTEKQKKQIEDMVNEKIKDNLEVIYKEMSLEQAKNSKAIGLFSDKYKEKVKVYSIGDFSKEICGGPHVKKTNELGRFRIIKEESVSAGIRRIKGILE